ncbi:hypothetical protein B0H11DRAFT_641790 [Mycena galericulata]|nr:hypothetical protein B0H11DRAFT_641790 [Mycena galericulata]
MEANASSRTDPPRAVVERRPCANPRTDGCLGSQHVDGPGDESSLAHHPKRGGRRADLHGIAREGGPRGARRRKERWLGAAFWATCGVCVQRRARRHRSVRYASAFVLAASSLACLARASRVPCTQLTCVLGAAWIDRDGVVGIAPDTDPPPSAPSSSRRAHHSSPHQIAHEVDLRPPTLLYLSSLRHPHPPSSLRPLRNLQHAVSAPCAVQRTPLPVGRRLLEGGTSMSDATENPGL